MQEALNNLKQDNAFMILPADKGRASVVLSIDTYHDKMKTLIETGPYQLLNKDPTDRLSQKLTEKLKTKLSTTKSNLGTNSHLGYMVNLRYTSPRYH